MIRFILVAIFLLLYFILGLPVLGAEWLIHKFSPEGSDYRCLRTVQWAFRCILFISGVKATIIGEERIPDEPVLFIGNHRSYFDILLTYSRCKSRTGYIAKKEMLRYPILRIWMKRLYCLFLDRTNPREGLKTILQAIDYVNRGISICIFPEGTRNKTPEEGLLPFRPGAFKVSEKTGCPVVPMAIYNTEDIFEKHLPFIRRAHVVVEYCPPVFPKEMDRNSRKKLPEVCQSVIEAAIEKNKALV